MNDRQKKRLAGEKLKQAGDLIRDALQVLESCEPLTLTQHTAKVLETAKNVCWTEAGKFYENITLFGEHEIAWLVPATEHHCCTADGSCHTGQHISGKCGPGCSQWEEEK